MHPTSPLRRSAPRGQALMAGLLLLGLGLSAPARAAPPEAPGTAPATATSASTQARSAPPEEVVWDDLMPPDWNPQADLGDLDVTAMSDGDPRAIKLLERLRTRWDQAPVNPAMDQRSVKIAGYVVPLESDREGMTEFLLVPYFGACIHTPPPPANQIIHIRAPRADRAWVAMETVWVEGVIRVETADTPMGRTGYRLDASRVKAFSG